MKQCIIGWINLSFLFNFRKIVCEIAYLVNVFPFGEIHPFGLRIKESPHSLVLETLVVTKRREDHGQWSLRSPALGLPSCRFIILVFPERFGHGLLRPVKVVQAFLYFIFFSGCGAGLALAIPRHGICSCVLRGFDSVPFLRRSLFISLHNSHWED